MDYEAKRCAVEAWRSNEHPGGMDWIDSAAIVIERFAQARAEQWHEAFDRSCDDVATWKSRTEAAEAELAALKASGEDVQPADNLFREIMGYVDAVSGLSDREAADLAIEAIRLRDASIRASKPAPSAEPAEDARELAKEAKYGRELSHGRVMYFSVEELAVKIERFAQARAEQWHEAFDRSCDDVATWKSRTEAAEAELAALKASNENGRVEQW